MAHDSFVIATRRAPVVRRFTGRAASLHVLSIAYLRPTGGGRAVVEQATEYDWCEHQWRL